MNVILWIAIGLLLLILTGILICYQWISIVSHPYIYHSIENLPSGRKGLLLGTAKLTREGNENLFFSFRVKKAAELYHSGKIQEIIISGADKHPLHKDEVDDMAKSLSKQSVPYHAIRKDHKGFRTWVSVWRCKNSYNIVSPLIISQKFHNQRAVFIARKMGMHPLALNAQKVHGRAGFIIIIREALAR
ncbi:MAG TPA: ElyC/SanA/YdcF family protein, partial [Chitinophagaceae bacterium]|nr:ElyC/SanA/YdcF family protein [Chitinophagaceae bacterium]